MPACRQTGTHYFWEFLMLFLAVFCGFYAEFQLEHKIERDREKQYVKSLLSDLRSDTMQINARLQFRQGKTHTLDSLMYLLKNKELPMLTGPLYYHGFYGPFQLSFYQTTGC